MAVTLAHFTPQSAKLPTTLRASLSTRNGIPILSFPDDGTDTAAIFLGVMPATASLGTTLSVLIRWTTTATTGDAVLGASIERDDAATDLDADSFDTEATVTTAAPGTSGFPATSTITFAAPTDFDSLAAGEQFRLKIRAVSSSGSYTLGAALQIMSVMLQEPGTAGGGSGGTTRVGARAYKSTPNQSINNDTLTTVTLDAEVYDTDSFHSTSSDTDRLTVPTGKDGLYMVIGSVHFASNATGARATYIFHKNSVGTNLGIQAQIVQAANGEVTIVNCTLGPVDAAATDYFTMQAYQESTVALNVLANASPAMYTSLTCIKVAD